ncbi:hypothetical protein EWM64_g1864 [Hericium alpestre]|uniref:Superoxide dismutase n=1 Tax=Hericium alpestre TaxID=135208 RepID=A0A4Z0A776_9AGAM|nr:hypothetical protein EWM64_g1864 [Hericium alpestre]
MVHTLPDLPYAYDALEPYISRQIMELHHKKHHQTYVNALNAAEEGYAKPPPPAPASLSTPRSSSTAVPCAGHINHSLFWKNLAPAKGHSGQLQPGPLADAINKSFGSLDNLKKEFNAATAGIQGSGWGWLVLDPKTKSLAITTTANQDPVTSQIPIIGVDVWEHAFYLQYLNVKVDYLNAIWNVIDFQEAEKRYNEGVSGQFKL